MRLSRVLRAGAVVTALALSVAACGGGKKADASDSLVDKASSAKKLTVGIKFDQPGLGLKKPDGSFEGFDVDVARYIAKELGVDAANVTFKEAQSKERENLIKNGDVDFIVATYSINDDRKKSVDFAGPYFIAGQDLLVKKGNTSITGKESLNGKNLCSVTGSTPAQNIKDKFSKEANLQQYGKYTDCISALLNGTVDAVSTDDVILAGYAAQYPGKLDLVGQPFTTEKYGVGLKKGDTKAQKAVNDAILKMENSGDWKKSLETNVGPSGYKIPDAPAITEK
ncbi:glutamate ABC transporter substrate-binding protein [Kutzneria viridogrisea]|uniref:Solute-binding protein family 3/N-terminal domain-containing protein n=2 Tax=Kutzneria TaxID=43356 RepID=W5WPC2_9PSEU|nr:glutamate ABC transporter substrate-binding protein [Kutzneria albida]AHI00035.1 hypothetical protein KALB_6675 [Kutzneria albida DSM 43870]MBA8925214.1 glutamate transport system substrate-binding protein [Kutzneria viridogrisea]